MKNRSLDEWAQAYYEKFPSIPGEGSIGENWLWFVGNIASPIAENIRLENFAKSTKLIGKALKWLCCFTYKYRNVSAEKIRLTKLISEMVWEKYSGLCYACAFLQIQDEISEKKYLPCICASIRMKMENRDSMLTKFQKDTNKFLIGEAKKYKTKPTTLDQWQGMTRDIYGPAHFDVSLSAICLHFIEEIGEVSRCIQNAQATDSTDSEQIKEAISELEDELADVFSWIFGLYNKIE